MPKLRVHHRNKEDELAFYKGVYMVRGLMIDRAQLMNEMQKVDQQIAEHLGHIKPYMTWDQLGEMLNLSGAQVKKYFGELIPNSEKMDDTK